MEFNSRPVTIRVWKNSPTVLVWLKATKNPLDFDEFDKFVYFLYGWASGKVARHLMDRNRVGLECGLR